MSTSPKETYAELHARPAISISVPRFVRHLAYGYHHRNKNEEIAKIRRFCDDLAADLGWRPYEEQRKGSEFWCSDAGNNQIKFIVHNEFISCTVYSPCAISSVEDLMGHIGSLCPWQASLSNSLCSDDFLYGKLLSRRSEKEGPLHVDIRLVVLQYDPEEDYHLVVPKIFGSDDIVGSMVGNQTAHVWLDFGKERWKEASSTLDGYSRTLILDSGMNKVRLGRLVRRLLEIETYVVMSLRNLPEARKQLQELVHKQSSLNEILRKVNDGVQHPEETLRELVELSEEVSAQISATRYALNASMAYAEIIKERIEELNEQKLERWLRIGTFVKRQFNPAVRTYGSVMRSQDALAHAIMEAGAMLRTRAELARNVTENRIKWIVSALSPFAVTYYAYHLTKELEEDLGKKLLIFIVSFSLLFIVPAFIRINAKCPICETIRSRFRKRGF